MRLFVLSLIARSLGIQVKVDGQPYGARVKYHHARVDSLSQSAHE